MLRLGGALVASAVVLVGCGSDVPAKVDGATGIGVDDRGNLVALVATCGSDPDRLTVSGDRTGLDDDEPNPVITTIDLPKATGGVATVVLARSGVVPGRTLDNGTVLERGRTYIANADRADEDAETTQVSFSVDRLDGLRPDQVLVRDDEVQSRADFEASSC